MRNDFSWRLGIIEESGCIPNPTVRSGSWFRVPAESELLGGVLFLAGEKALEVLSPSQKLLPARGTHARKRPGGSTFALRRSSGKSFGFKVTMKSALPCSEQRQNGSSLGSGEISTKERTLISSARSRIKLMTLPIRFERTRRRFRISLYSSRCLRSRARRNCCPLPTFGVRQHSDSDQEQKAL
jgi:hypothetical protein